jgi:hypothetical protein
MSSDCLRDLHLFQGVRGESAPVRCRFWSRPVSKCCRQVSQFDQPQRVSLLPARDFTLKCPHSVRHTIQLTAPICWSRSPAGGRPFDGASLRQDWAL